MFVYLAVSHVFYPLTVVQDEPAKIRRVFPAKGCVSGFEAVIVGSLMKAGFAVKVRVGKLTFPCLMLHVHICTLTQARGRMLAHTCTHFHHAHTVTHTHGSTHEQTRRPKIVHSSGALHEVGVGVKGLVEGMERLL